jgi:hypothetical protein
MGRGVKFLSGGDCEYQGGKLSRFWSKFYVQEFCLCMRHLYGGERGDLLDSPMGALEENYQDFCPNYTS